MATPRKRTRRPSAPTTPDPIEIAMEAEAGDNSPDSPARRLLIDQGRLIQADLIHRRWQIASERAGFILKCLMGAAGVGAALILAVMAWNASRADGLVIKPFSVPPSLVARGVTGEAVASGLMDRLSAIGDIARSGEVQRQVAGDLGQEISIQIPETGVSLSQIDQWLKEKLGHERRVTGEVIIREDGSVILNTRIGSLALPDQTGAVSDLPALLQKAAEAVYAREQQGSYGTYLNRQGRFEDGVAFARTLIARRSARDKAEGYARLGYFLGWTSGLQAERAAYYRSLAIDPDAPNYARGNLSGIEQSLGRVETAYRLGSQIRTLLERRDYGAGSTREAVRQRLVDTTGNLGEATGDFGTALKMNSDLARAELQGFNANSAPLLDVAQDHANLHDVRRAKAALASFEPDNEAAQAFAKMATVSTIALATGDWPGALTAIDARIAAPQRRLSNRETQIAILGLRAKVLIELGRLDEAQAQLDATPLDCQPCVVERGRLAAARGDARLADHWLSWAVRMAPSLPQASYEWGRVLLARGDAARAVAQFQIANQGGPRWADPLLGWGEALLAKGDFKGATVKFKAAAKLAPNWGRAEMLWGEALGKLGKTDMARDHWRKAGAMFLTPAEIPRLAADLKGAPA